MLKESNASLNPDAPMTVIVERLLDGKMTAEEFSKALFVTLSQRGRRTLLMELANEILYTAKVMRCMSMMLDIPGVSFQSKSLGHCQLPHGKRFPLQDIMDIQTLAKALLKQAMALCKASAGRLLIRQGPLIAVLSEIDQRTSMNSNSGNFMAIAYSCLLN